jgi:RNA polymerase sigma-70 factor (ECF subfamily)
MPDERQLLNAAASGDEKAFRVLIETHWKRVYFNTLALVKSPAVAQELTQDIFLKVWKQAGKLATVESLPEYLYVLGRNQTISYLRKKLIDTAEVTSATAIEDVLLPDLQLEGKDAYRVVLEGIERLSPQQRLIFRMSRIDGLSHEEIAGRLQLSKNTVKAHMVIALNFMRTWIKERLK